MRNYDLLRYRYLRPIRSSTSCTEARNGPSVSIFRLVIAAATYKPFGIESRLVVVPAVENQIAWGMLERSQIALKRIIYPHVDLQTFLKITADLDLGFVEIRNDLPDREVCGDLDPEFFKMPPCRVTWSRSDSGSLPYAHFSPEVQNLPRRKFVEAVSRCVDLLLDSCSI